MKKSHLLTIFLIVFIDLLGFSLILPLLPYYADSFGATPMMTGLLVATYAAAQLAGAPILGRLSDRLGRRPVLLMSVAGTAIGFLLLGFADPIGRRLAVWIDPLAENAVILGLLFLSRIIDGLTGGNISVAQAYIADVTDESNRAKGLGLIGAAFGLGFIIGPVVGGMLSRISFGLPALAAASLAAFNLAAIWLFLPESLTVELRKEMSARRRPPFTLMALFEVLRRPVVGPLLHIRLIYGLGFATFQTVFSLFSQGIGLDAQATGYIMGYIGLLVVITQAGLIGFLTRRIAEQRLIIGGLCLMAFSLFAWAFSREVMLLLIVILPLALSGGVLNTILQSILSKSVARDEIGGILGISASLEAVTRVIAPSVGGLLLQNIGLWAPGVFAALLLVWAASFAFRRMIKTEHRVPSENGYETGSVV